MTPTYAVIPSGGRDCLYDGLKALLPQVDTLFLVRTEEFGFRPFWSFLDSKMSFIDDFEQPKNISRWWNYGITAAAQYARAFSQPEWNVLIVNDDVIPCAQLVQSLDAGLRTQTMYPGSRPVLAYPDNYPPYSRWGFHTTPGQVQLSTRISGWCFMLRGEVNLLADERLAWFYTDDHLDWRAREQGGAIMVPDCPVEHLHPNELTNASSELTAQTHVDRQTFQRIWGALPH